MGALPPVDAAGASPGDIGGTARTPRPGRRGGGRARPARRSRRRARPRPSAAAASAPASSCGAGTAPVDGRPSAMARQCLAPLRRAGAHIWRRSRRLDRHAFGAAPRNSTPCGAAAPGGPAPRRRRPTARAGPRSARGRGTPASAPGWRAGPGPRRPLAHDLDGRCVSGRPARTSFRIASTTLSPTGMRRTRRCADSSSAAVIACAACLVDAGGGDQHLPLGFVVGIVDIDLQQEAVELRFGQRIGAFLLQRVLRRQHVERRGQVVATGRRPRRAAPASPAAAPTGCAGWRG